MVLAVPATLHFTFLTLFTFLTSPSYGQSFRTLSVQTIPVATLPAPRPQITGPQCYEVISEVIAVVEENVPVDPTDTSTQTVVSVSPSSPAVLLPAVHPNVDVTDYSNVVPQEQIELYYSEPLGTIGSRKPSHGVASIQSLKHVQF